VGFIADRTAAWHDTAMPRRSVSLFRRIERALETIALGSTPLETIHETAHLLCESFSPDLGIQGGRIYVQDDGTYELVTTFGEVTKAPIGLRVWRHYPPFDQLLDTGAIVMGRNDPRLDQRLEEDLGTRDLFAAISVADGRYVLSFDVEPGRGDLDDVIATLNILRLAINQKLREDRVLEIMEEARLIQHSILPRHLPHPDDFRIAARSVAAEIVGGDFYDVIELDVGVFAVAIADATGHGLPAALQVRDVFTGLRMGLSRDFKITRTVERLNRIIHRSRLATKFVSLFLAELDPNGTVIYCNAGHPPPILITASGDVERLATGGMILGPTPNAVYTIGVAAMAPGDTLVLFSDGIVEATRDDEEYGDDRLLAVLRTARRLDPTAIVERVFADVADYQVETTPRDDQTLVVVQRVTSDGPEGVA
jgi:sigma-B regulation protein RsbU (phosphoserine phosphatase)